MISKAFLTYNPQIDRYKLDWRQTLSIIAGELLLKELLAVRPIMKGRLLDVGCGKRPYSLIYDPLVNHSVGTEVSYSPHSTAMADLVCFGEGLPFSSESFDVIICTEVLEHTVKPWLVMHELARVLRPGGYLFASVPFNYPIHEAPQDNWRFTPFGLEKLCQYAGLEPDYVRNKDGTLALALSFMIIWAVMALNGIGKLLKLRVPLRERLWIRWLLALPQWTYLWLRARLSRNDRTNVLASRFTLGYVILAHKAAGQEMQSGDVNG